MQVGCKAQFTVRNAKMRSTNRNDDLNLDDAANEFLVDVKIDGAMGSEYSYALPKDSNVNIPIYTTPQVTPISAALENVSSTKEAYAPVFGPKFQWPKSGQTWVGESEEPV